MPRSWPAEGQRHWWAAVGGTGVRHGQEGGSPALGGQSGSQGSAGAGLTLPLWMSLSYLDGAASGLA